MNKIMLLTVLVALFLVFATVAITVTPSGDRGVDWGQILTTTIYIPRSEVAIVPSTIHEATGNPTGVDVASGFSVYVHASLATKTDELNSYAVPFSVSYGDGNREVFLGTFGEDGHNDTFFLGTNASIAALTHNPELDEFIVTYGGDIPPLTLKSQTL